MNHKTNTLQLITWLASITRQVHTPLIASTLFRITTQSLDIALFALAGWTIATALTSSLPHSALYALIALALTRALTHYLEQFTGHYVAFKALETLRGYAYSRLWHKAPGISLTQHSGSILTNLTRDIDRIEVVYAHTVAPLISAVTVPALALGITAYHFGLPLIIIPLICVLISVLIIPALGFRASVHATEKTLESRANLTAHISDTVHGITETLIYGRQNQRAQEQAQLGDAVLTSALPAARFKALRRAANLLLSLITVTSIIALAITNNINPVWATTLALGATRLFEGPKGIESAVGYLDQSLSATRRIWTLAHTPDRITDDQKPLTLKAAPRIEWVKATYHYPTAAPGAAPALNQVNALAEAGKRTVFIGSSGSGKTTAIQALLRFDELDAGHILINGTPITDYSADTLRRAVVLVSQKSQVLTGSIAENLRLGAPNASDQDLWDALATACLADEITAMPEGLNTQVGNGGSELSGGQLQRLALARALLIKPWVLVLDEFTASLNSALETRIRSNLAQQYPHLTLIEVTHRLEQLDGAHAIYRFEKGTAVRDNSEQTPAEKSCNP